MRPPCSDVASILPRDGRGPWANRFAPWPYASLLNLFTPDVMTDLTGYASCGVPGPRLLYPGVPNLGQQPHTGRPTQPEVPLFLALFSLSRTSPAFYRAWRSQAS